MPTDPSSSGFSGVFDMIGQAIKEAMSQLLNSIISMLESLG